MDMMGSCSIRLTWGSRDSGSTILASSRVLGRADPTLNPTSAFVERVPKLLVGQDIPERGENCSVCGKEYKPSELVAKPGLLCSHTAHVGCALQWHLRYRRWNQGDNCLHWVSTCVACGQPVVPSQWGARTVVECESQPKYSHAVLPANSVDPI
jgi:hypothetical protein